MRKFFAVFLSVLLCLTSIVPAFAAETPRSKIGSNTYDFICELVSAISDEGPYADAFADKTDLYLCDSINPYYFSDDDLIINEDIEYYLIRSSSQYVGCITVCYDNGTACSASFDADISSALTYNGLVNSSFALVCCDGILYIVSGTQVFQWNSSTGANAANTSEDIISNIRSSSPMQTIPAELCSLSEISANTTRAATPRISESMNVPYVPQGEYDICWAAAAASLGEYYTGIARDAYELALIIKGDAVLGTLDDAVEILKFEYGISTATKAGSISNSTIMNYLLGRVPLLSSFYDTNIERGHMVVISGFYYSGNYTHYMFYIVDPNYPSVQIVTVGTNSTFILDYYAGVSMSLRTITYKS